MQPHGRPLLHLVAVSLLTVALLALGPTASAGHETTAPGLEVEADALWRELKGDYQLLPPRSAGSPEEGGGGGVIHCDGGDVILQPPSRDEEFEFVEASDQQGCGGVLLRVPIPHGASSLEVSFSADRRIEPGTTQAADPVGTRFVQQLRLYAEEEGFRRSSGGYQEPRFSIDLFPVDAAPTGRTAFLYPWNVSGTDVVVLEWWFKDAGSAEPPQSALVPANPEGRSHHRVASLVADAMIRFPSIPLLVDEARHDSSTATVRELHQSWRATTATTLTGASNRTMIEALHITVTGRHDAIHVSGPKNMEWSASPDGLSDPMKATYAFLPESDIHLPHGRYVILSSATLAKHATWPMTLATVAAVAAPAIAAAPRMARRRQGRPSARGLADYILHWNRFPTALLALWGTLVAVFIGLGWWSSAAAPPVSWHGLAFFALALAFLGGAVMDGHVQTRRRAHASEGALVETTARAEELDLFLTGAAHDLKTPLIVLDWLTKDLQAELEAAAPTPAVQEGLERIRQNLGGMETLVKDLLDLREAEEDAVRKRIALRQAVESAIQGLADEAQDVGARVENRVPADSFVTASPARIRHILHNLISNALRYGRPNDGTVRVDAALDPTGRLLLAVEDDGPGVPPEERALIFEMFRRGTTGVARATGTGLGLALVARMARAEGGRVDVRDGPSLGGARFEVSLDPRPA